MTEQKIFLILGLIFIPMSIFAFFKPRIFLKSRKSRFWIGIIGEDKTVAMIKFISAPLGLAMSLYFVAVGLDIAPTPGSSKPAPESIER